MKRSRAIGGLVVAVFLSEAGQNPASAAVTPADANQLVREVIESEIRAEANQTDLWSYRELTKRNGKETLVEYCQTKYGTLHHLLAVNGRRLTAAQDDAENKRLRKLTHSPAAMRAARRKLSADAQEEKKFLNLLPDVFRYQQTGVEGDRVELSFRPNPRFQPSGMEARVLHNLEGTMVLDIKQKRLASVKGRLMNEVKFFHGLLGHLDEGGRFSVVSERVAPDDWELQSLDVGMSGKALFLKTLTLREQDLYSDYTLVPPPTTLEQAAERLEKDASAFADSGRAVEESKR
jgi:hypothetical protein